MTLHWICMIINFKQFFATTHSMLVRGANLHPKIPPPKQA
jgi:hypothetical protein